MAKKIWIRHRDFEVKYQIIRPVNWPEGLSLKLRGEHGGFSYLPVTEYVKNWCVTTDPEESD